MFFYFWETMCVNTLDCTGFKYLFILLSFYKHSINTVLKKMFHFIVSWFLCKHSCRIKIKYTQMSIYRYTDVCRTYLDYFLKGMMSALHPLKFALITHTHTQTLIWIARTQRHIWLQSHCKSQVIQLINTIFTEVNDKL